MNTFKLWNNPAKSMLVLFAGLFFCGQLNAQVELRREFPSKQVIDDFDNTTFCTAFLSDGGLYTLRDIPIVNIKKIKKIVFNPTGSSLAVLREEKPIRIYSFRIRDRKMFELKEERKFKGVKEKPMPVAMCYASDARTFVMSNTFGEIVAYDTREYLPQAYIQGEGIATCLAMSSNNYFIAAGVDKNIDIWNFQTKRKRATIPMPAVVKELTFSEDASLLAVVTDDNRLTIIDTKTWDKVDIFDQIRGVVSSPSFHPEGKYVSVVRDNNSIVIINLKNSHVEQTITGNEGVKNCRFFMNRQTSDVFLLSNVTHSLVFWDANGLNPFFGKLLNREIDEIEEQIQSIMDELHSPITSIPGMGFRMAAMILAEVGDFTRFDSPDKLLAYAGMSPSTYQSGQLKNCYPHMEKRGSRYLRYALYNATQYVCHWDPAFADYLAKKRAEGKHYNLAISHAAKKLVRLIFALEKSRQPYCSAA